MDQRKLAIVTGAAGGIGQALLAEFARRGHRLFAVDLPGSDLAAIVARFGEGHLWHECNLGNEGEIVAMYERIDREVGRVDILANNAAVGPTMATTVNTDLAQFRLTMQVNFYGAFVMAREAAKRMQKGGAIVNTASQAGVLGNPTRNAYAASKAAVISMTKSLAAEWASKGIRVTAVAPGYVRTPMVAELESSGKVDMSITRRRIPVGRIGRPDEIASAIGFLSSPEARYVTGSCLAVDGAWAAFNQPGHAHPEVIGIPAAELEAPAATESGRVVVVTGGGRGIGAAIVRQFASQGDKVVVLDREGAEEAAAELGPDSLGIALDITDDEAVSAAFEQIKQRYGHVDVLVNDAAIADVFKPAVEQTFEDLARVMEVNVTGAFNCVKQTLALMPDGAGVIVNLGSINTFLPFAPRHAYGASKAAIDILTRCLAAELGPQGKRVVTVAPGYIRTPGVEDLERNNRIDTGAICRRIPMGDMGKPQDIANAVYFVASPAASYISGSILYVDGGWTSFGNAGDASTGDFEP
ncbi:short-chain dehydrogenase [Nitratireductor aestuarii]|uniref:Short-chain dehydrogenase n=1 Tax=Nitratireductor aestuarii TaxID=1735103 RepID=A0A916RS98_9HYPH|nr:SDR family oxidoreductase [Nitratireductor aestuarii]GGA66575.1 short-chain dehydrogenase [Nitratireductor aestuarii]